MPEEEAKTEVSRGKPPELLVPTFNKLGTEALRRHLVTAHNATVASIAPTGSTITNHFQKASTIDKVALMFCMNPSVPFRLVDDPFFLQAFGPSGGRQPLPRAICDISHGLEGRVNQRIRGSIVALVDGWTNWRHEKTMNFVIILSSVAS